jgi:signal transduction histidine kinase
LTTNEPSVFLPAMHGDREKTVRIIVSLLSNAYKFAPDGEVRVSVDVAGGRVRYRVADDGPGIPESAQQFVFDEFRQLDGSITRKAGGAGLGLPLARGLARFLGGDVELVAEVARGAEFVVELPLDRARGRGHTARETREARE